MEIWAKNSIGIFQNKKSSEAQQKFTFLREITYEISNRRVNI